MAETHVGGGAVKLDIIVPHYKEPWEVCKYLFDSIALQRGVLFDNIRVIVVNDGDECVPDLSLTLDYPYRIVWSIKKHGGVSDTRNYGLDKSDADYVMFCDADDGFLNNYGLHLVFAAMQEGFDLLCGSFIEETWDANGNPIIVPHTRDMTFMHGKAYRRQFLVDNELRFDPRMTVHEDGYFNMLTYAVAKKSGTIKYIDTPFYQWMWHGESTVRKDRKDFTLKTYPDVMLTRIGLCDELKRRGLTEAFEDSVCMTVLNSYYDFQKTSYRTAENKKYAKAGKKAFKEFYTRFGKTFLACTNLKVAEVAKVARENALKKGLLIEEESLRAWLKHIEYEVK